MIINLCSWGDVAGGEQIVHIWLYLNPYYCQTTLVNNSNFSGMLVNFVIYWKNNIIYIVTFKGQII